MPEPAVVVAMREFKRGIAAREALQMRGMATAWLEVEGALNTRIVDLAEKMNAKKEAGESVSEAAMFKMDRYQALIRQTQQEFGAYAQYADKDLTAYQGRSAELGIAHSQRAIELSYGPQGVMAVFNRLPVEAVQHLIGIAGDGKPLGDLLQSRMVRDARGNPLPGVLERLNTSLLVGTALGRNPRVVARDMRNDLAGGLNKALVIARTEGLRPYRESSRDQYEASGVVEGQKRLSAHDGRVCAGCLADDGSRYSIKESIRDHPNGRCTGVPIVKGMPEVTWTSGEDWIREQSGAFQQKLLGKARYDLWASGAVPFKAFAQRTDSRVWGGGIQPRSISDLISEYGPAKAMGPQAMPKAALVIDLPPHMLGWVTINEAAVMLGHSHTTKVRELLKKGILVGEKVPIGKRKKWFIDPASVNDYLSSLGKTPIKPTPPDDVAPPKGWQTASEVALTLKKTEEQVVTLCKEGTFRGVFLAKIWYIDPDSVEQYLKDLLKIPKGFKRDKKGNLSKTGKNYIISVSKIDQGWLVYIRLLGPTGNQIGTQEEVYVTQDDALAAVGVWERTGKLPKPDAAPDLSSWYTTRQAADVLGHKTTSKVLAMVRTGVLEGRKITVGKKQQWRINPASVQTFLDSQVGVVPPKGWMRIDIASTTYVIRVPEIEEAIQKGLIAGKPYKVGSVTYIFVDPKSVETWITDTKTNVPPPGWVRTGVAALRLSLTATEVENLVQVGTLEGRWITVKGTKYLYINPVSIEAYLKKPPTVKTDLLSINAITKEFGVSRPIVVRIIKQYGVVGVSQVRRGRTLTLYSRAEFTAAYAQDKGGKDKPPKGWLTASAAASEMLDLEVADVLALIRTGEVTGKIISIATGDVGYVDPAAWKAYKARQKIRLGWVTYAVLAHTYKSSVGHVGKLVAKYGLKVELFPVKGRFREHVNEGDFDDAWTAEQHAKLPKPTDVPPPGWVSGRDAASMLGLTSTATVTKYIHAGKLIGKKVKGYWYVDPASITAFAATRKGAKKVVKKIVKKVPKGWLPLLLAAPALRIRLSDLNNLIAKYSITTHYIVKQRGRIGSTYVDPNAVEPYIDMAGIVRKRSYDERLKDAKKVATDMKAVYADTQGEIKQLRREYDDYRHANWEDRKGILKLRAGVKAAKARQLAKLHKVLEVPVEDRLEINMTEDPGRKVPKGSKPKDKSVQAARDGIAWLKKVVSRKVVDRSSTRVGEADSGRAFYLAQGIYLHGDGPDIAIHEMGHAIEDMDTEIHAEVLDFYHRRTKGEKPRWLGKNYHNDEKARYDKFIVPYMGKDYGDDYTEILSMGIEFLYKDPARLLRRDEDYFTMVLAVIRE